MKCNFCGNNLTIDDAKCPFCGKDNSFAKKHRSQMAHYEREFASTKQTVEKTTKRISATAIRITILAVLAALIFLVVMLKERYAYDIRSWIRSNNVEKNLQEHMQNMHDFEANREYFKLAYYYDELHLGDNKNFKEYEMLAMVCKQYARGYSQIMDIKFGEESPGYTNQEKLEYLSGNINSMYSWSEVRKYDRNNCYAEHHLACMEDAKDEMEAMLVKYCGITKEEAAKLESMPEAQREVLIGRGLGIYE